MKNPVLPEDFVLPIASPAPATTPARCASTSLAPPNVETPEAPLDLDSCAQRESEQGARYDAAILQALREHVWGVLSSRKNPEEIAKVFPLLISARKQAMAERKASGQSPSSNSKPGNPIIDQIVDPELRISPHDANPLPSGSR